MQPLLEEFAKETPAHFPASISSALRQINRRGRWEPWGNPLMLFTAVGVLLAIGCTNVHPVLARRTGRRRKFAVRAALGASRMRLVGQMFTNWCC